MVGQATQGQPAHQEPLRVRVAEPLRFLLASRNRDGDFTVSVEGVSSLGHLVESIGVPRTEVGSLLVNGTLMAAGHRPASGDVVDVLPVTRPQPIAAARFLLDVHLGTLARRMRLLGLDTAYHTDADDPALVVQANAEGRVLLTQDRGLLRRRALIIGAYVRGSDPDDQLADVLSRFQPTLTPWTRCPACNGKLEPVEKHEVEHLLEPGTRQRYAEFFRCPGCGRPYWRGAHADRLSAIVDRALVGDGAGKGGARY